MCRGGIEVIALSRTKPEYDCIHIETDLSKEESISKACEMIKKKYNSFNALVNCAGIISIQKPNSISYEELSNLMKVNTIAPIFLTSGLFDLIKENEADVMNVGSTVGKKAVIDQCAYATSKWGMRGTSLNFQLELKNTRCRVVQFNVGGMNTRMHTKYNGVPISDPEAWMNPKDIAEFMLHILNLPKQMEITEIDINRKSL